MGIFDFLKGLTGDGGPGNLDEAFELAASQKKLVLVDIFSPL